MRRALASTCVLSCLALAAPASHADIMVGGMGAPAGTTHPLSQFSSLAQGTMLPQRQIAGPDIQLHEPNFGVYEPNQQLIYMSDFRGQAIRVFPAFASGDVAPLRVLNPPLLGQTRANAPVFAHNELGVIAGNCCIHTYPLDASGDAVWRIRGVSWGGGGGSVTELNSPGALTYLPASDEYAVIDYDYTPPHSARILFHHRSADGNVPPTRRITGPHVANAVGMAYDPAMRRIFVLRVDQQPFPSTSFGAIQVFDDTASGDVVPLHTITSTELYVQSGHYFVGLGYDAYTQRLMISSTQPGNPAGNRIVSFSAHAAGASSPIQMLNGTSLSQHTVGVPFGVPSVAPAQAPLVAIAHPTVLAWGRTSALAWHGGQGNGAVTFAVTSGAQACTIDDTTLTAIALGACTVTATKAASFSFPEQTASIGLTVVIAHQTPLSIDVTPTTLAVGGTSTLTAQGGSGTGAVEFRLAAGAGICAIQDSTLTALAPGTCAVYASKLGDEHHHGVSSPLTTVTVMAGNDLFTDGFEAALPQG